MKAHRFTLLPLDGEEMKGSWNQVREKKLMENINKGKESRQTGDCIWKKTTRVGFT